jgi:hypothetical protein
MRRQSVSQQDRGDPGIHELPAGRAHAAAADIDLPDALRLRPAHAGRAQRLSAQDGVAVPRLLGIRKTDPMLSDMGIDSIPTAEGAMLDQAVNRTAVVTVGDVRNDGTA